MDDIWQRLPQELMIETLSHAMVQDAPCAFRVFVPEWKLCSDKGQCDSPHAPRIDSFTVSTNHVSHVSTACGHGLCNHLFLPILEDGSGRQRFSRFVDRELVKAWTDRSLCAYGQQLHQPGVVGGFEAANMLNDARAVSLLPYVDEPRECVKDVLPFLTKAGDQQQPMFLHQRIQHLMLNTSPAMMALSEDSFVGDQRAAGRRLERERQAHLLVDFCRLDRLRSLFLDLRAVGRGEIDYAVVEAAARNLSVRATRTQGLELLVIAGLRSYQNFPGHAPLSADGVNQCFVASWDPNAFGDHVQTWRLMSLFTSAVRPGGQVLFVDKQYD